MPIRGLAVLAVFCSTAMPTGWLGIMAFEDSRLPTCDSNASQTVSQCVDAISGLKYSPERYRKIGR